MFKLSIATSYTNPEKRMDPWREALACYEDLADEVVRSGWVLAGPRWLLDNDSIGSASERLPVSGNQHDEQQDRDRDDHKRVALGPKDDQPNGKRQEGSGHPSQRRQPHGIDFPRLAEDRARVQTHVEVDAVPQRDISSEAADQVPTRCHDGVEHANNEDGLFVPRVSNHQRVEDQQADQDDRKED